MDSPPRNARAPQNHAGRGHLRVDMVSGQSAVTSAWASSPLKTLIPRPRGASVWAYLGSLGGGLVAGDETSMTLDLREQTCCFVTTQASTKVYRNPDSRPCGHRLRATLAPGARLVLMPDPVQAFAGSCYRQRQEFRLEAGSGLVLVDWLCSGRVAYGERWAFHRFESRNDVFLGTERVFVDSLRLDPMDGPLESPHRLGRFNCLGLVLILGDPLRSASARLLADVEAQPLARRASIVSSASPVQHGAVLRIAGDRVEEVGREIHRHLAFVADLLEDDPWSRKW
ncbi:MAG: urease accessory protein UreD [Limisphaerales bacterium]